MSNNHRNLGGRVLNVIDKLLWASAALRLSHKIFCGRQTPSSAPKQSKGSLSKPPVLRPFDRLRAGVVQDGLVSTYGTNDETKKTELQKGH